MVEGKRIARQAFSLIELSVVLVILGLLAGAVVAGQSLIRSAELRSVTEDFQRYNTAIQAFRDKYQALPGDMSNATGFWTSTVNGNGDGIIGYGTTASATGETFQAWRQLALAGLLEGSYSGNAGPTVTNGTAGQNYVFGTNSPASKISGVGWMISYIDNSGSTTTSSFNNDYTQWMGVGGGSGTGIPPIAGFLTASEAWNIDTKIDDGMPDTGAVNSNVTNCTLSSATTPNTDTTATYNVNLTTDSVCSLLFQY